MNTFTRVRALTTTWTLALAFGLLAACGDAPAPEVVAETVPRSDASAPSPSGPAVSGTRIAQSSNALGWRILGRLIDQSNEDEPMIALSPLGVAMTLTVAGDGASGGQRASIARLLGIGEGGFAEAAEALRGIGRLGDSPAPVTLSVANGLWLAQGVTLDADYRSRQTQVLELTASIVDFAAAQTTDLINDWVSERTGGNITDLLEGVDPRASFVLVNALYFNAPWQQAFDAAETVEAPFTLPDGRQVNVALMQRETSLPYHHDATLGQVASLPFGGERYRLTMLLPADRAALESADGLASVLPLLEAQRSPTQVRLALPRLDRQARFDLLNTLTALGLENSGEFDAMLETQGALPIGQIAHAVDLRWDEAGAEAAAATAVTTSRMAVDVTDMRLDRSFLAAIEDAETGAILFLVIIRNPA